MKHNEREFGEVQRVQGPKTAQELRELIDRCWNLFFSLSFFVFFLQGMSLSFFRTWALG